MVLVAAMVKPCLTYLTAAEWPRSVAAVVMGAVKRAFQMRGGCSIMLTGGRSAERFYRTWAALPDFARLRNVRFFFGDERCMPPDHEESNYGLVMRTLFQHGVPSSCEVFRIPAERPDREAITLAYEAQLPERLDVLLLSLGDDGHIASLFPHSAPLLETRRRVTFVQAPEPLVDRITITPRVISQAHSIYVMAFGQTKADLYQQAKADPENIADLPARLVLNATWFLDTQPRSKSN